MQITPRHIVKFQEPGTKKIALASRERIKTASQDDAERPRDLSAAALEDGKREHGFQDSKGKYFQS